jgi:hypothetical protein
MTSRSPSAILGFIAVSNNDGYEIQGRQATTVRFDPLADNGDPTLTHGLLFGSPAFDAGDDAVCPATDQRGVARSQGVACDVSAYEYEP